MIFIKNFALWPFLNECLVAGITVFMQGKHYATSNRLCYKNFYRKRNGEITWPLVKEVHQWFHRNSTIPNPGSHNGQNNGHQKTVHIILSVITAWKLSPFCVSFDVRNSAGLYVISTVAMTQGQRIGIIGNTCIQLFRENPISKQVISGAIMFIDITESVTRKRMNSRLLRGSFM